MGLSDSYFELDSQEWVYDRDYYERRLNKLKRDQEELALEVIHYNNHRKFSLTCHCIESTLAIILTFISCYFFWKGTPMEYLFGIMTAAAFVIPITVHTIIGWAKCIKEEKKRSEGIERLKRIQSEIDSIHNKVLY